jgi:predicted AlkP superfamily pyrophosphatase or phosphodiesterase
VSGPGWATIATGVWPDKHRVLDNDWGPATGLTQYPDFLTRLKLADSSLTTYAIADWPPLTSDSAGQAIFSAAIDVRVTIEGDTLGLDVADTRVAAEAADYLGRVGPDASFVYFGEVDHAGHTSGAASAYYRTAIENTDRHIGTVLAGIRSRPTYAEEDWTYVVTSDHGHTDAGGHGGSSAPERASFIIHTGPGIPPTTPATEPKNVDIAVTVLSHFGVTPDPTWQLDGRPLLV